MTVLIVGQPESPPPHHDRVTSSKHVHRRAAPPFGCPCFDDRIHRVVVGALVRGAKVLLLHRSPTKRAYRDVWDPPGGAVEAGETELVALARELNEELRVRIAPASTSRLFQLEAGPESDRVLLSAWLVPAWQGTPDERGPGGARRHRVVQRR
ncbi:MAG: NUDIX domain-containing protein [Motilibacteraceae bacterium]